MKTEHLVLLIILIITSVALYFPENSNELAKMVITGLLGFLTSEVKDK